MSYPVPTTKTAVRSVLGLAGYYRDFIPGFASHSTSLTNLTRKSVPEAVQWTPELIIPLPTDVFTLKTDASGFGIGAVLTVLRDGVEHPVAYYSRKLSPAEQNYSATELEGLAVMVSITHFSVYLYGTTFTVQTDHRALAFLHSMKLLTGCLARWALLLQQYIFKITYRAGSRNQNADGLSRCYQAPASSKINREGGGGRCCAIPQYEYLNTFYLLVCTCNYYFLVYL